MNNSNIKTTYYGDKQERYQPYTGRFLVFGCLIYYPSGGQGDVLYSVDTLAEVVAMFRDLRTPQTTDWNELQEKTNGNRVQQIDVFDMEERRFIDIDILEFEP